MLVVGLAQSEEGKPVTAEGEIAVLQSMSKRLQAAMRGDWESHPVIPLNVAEPQEGTVWISPIGVLMKKFIIAWPKEEYKRWRLAWTFIADTVLHRLGTQLAFPLGDGDKATSSYSLVAATPTSLPSADVRPTSAQMTAYGFIDTLPSIQDAFLAVTTLIAEYKRATGKPAGERKAIVSIKMIVGLAVAALVGGAIYYYYHRQPTKAYDRLPQ